MLLGDSSAVGKASVVLVVVLVGASHCSDGSVSVVVLEGADSRVGDSLLMDCNRNRRWEIEMY